MDTSQESLAGKVCLVTGATSGIGKVTARELARRGATVVIVGRSEARSVATVSQISSRPPIHPSIFCWRTYRPNKKAADWLGSSRAATLAWMCW